jgi:DNA-binding CsgD family transcriptional regulator
MDDTPILTHRDGNLLILENKIEKMWRAGVSDAEIAKRLGLPEAVVAAIVERNAPATPVRVRRGS